VKKQANKVIADDYKLLTYLVFDAPTHGGKYEDRVKWLQTNVPQDDDKCYASVVGIKKCQGLADLKQCLADVNKAGGEGIMLRKPGSRYENKRSSTLLKVKTFYDEGKLNLKTKHISSKKTLSLFSRSFSHRSQTW
jgi:DNA ligase-1